MGKPTPENVAKAILEMPEDERLIYVSRLVKERDTLVQVVGRIASYCDPDDDAFEEDEQGFSEWGCDRTEAIEMAYEDIIQEAKGAYDQIDMKLPPALITIQEA